MQADVHPVGSAGAAIGETPVRRRGVLAALAAVPLLIAATTTRWLPAPPARRARLDPEPLRTFLGLAEGFYQSGAHVYYLDEHAATWAPRTLDPISLVPLGTLTPQALPDLLRQLRRRHWSWSVEHAALRLADADRPRAIALLAEALRRDPLALRLADLLAVLLAYSAPHRLDPLIDLMAPAATRSKAAAARLAKWRSPSWSAPPVWRSPATDGRAFATLIQPR